METEKKKIPSFTIDIFPPENVDGKIKQKVIITPEIEANTWYRNRLDRKKDGLVVQEVQDDIMRIGLNLSKRNEEGKWVGKYKKTWMAHLPPNPKSSKSAKKKYSSYLKESINQQNKNNELSNFVGEDKLVYIVVYLGDKRYNSGNDADNFAKVILDTLKPFMGDDSKVTLLIVEKRLVSGYPKEDTDFIEQAIVFVTLPEAREDILKNRAV